MPDSGENTWLAEAQQKRLARICTGGRIHDFSFHELLGSVWNTIVTGCNLLHIGTFSAQLPCQTKLLTTISSILGCTRNMWLGCCFMSLRSAIGTGSNTYLRSWAETSVRCLAMYPASMGSPSLPAVTWSFRTDGFCLGLFTKKTPSQFLGETRAAASVWQTPRLGERD